MTSCGPWPTDCASHAIRFKPTDDAGDDFVLCFANGTNPIYYQATCRGMQSSSPKTYMAIQASGINTDSSFKKSSKRIESAALVVTPQYLALDLCDTAHLDQTLQDARIFAGSIFTCAFQVDAYTADFSLLDNSSFIIAKGVTKPPVGPTSSAEGSWTSPWGAQFEVGGINGPSFARAGQVSASGLTYSSAVNVNADISANDTTGCVWSLMGSFLYFDGPVTAAAGGAQSWSGYLHGGDAFPDWPGRRCEVSVNLHTVSGAPSWSLSSSVMLGWDGRNTLTQFDHTSGRLQSHQASGAPASSSTATAAAAASSAPSTTSTPAAGIAVGVCAVVLIAVAAAFIFHRRRATRAAVIAGALGKPAPPSTSNNTLPLDSRDLHSFSASSAPSSDPDLYLSTLSRSKPASHNVHHLQGSEMMILPDAPAEPILLHTQTVPRPVDK
ncbi:hypothetical protein RI367_003888 [Sorochytrium milnesiophthora]